MVSVSESNMEKVEELKAYWLEHLPEKAVLVFDDSVTTDELDEWYGYIQNEIKKENFEIAGFLWEVSLDTKVDSEIRSHCLEALVAARAWSFEDARRFSHNAVLELLFDLDSEMRFVAVACVNDLYDAHEFKNAVLYLLKHDSDESVKRAAKACLRLSWPDSLDS